MKGLMLLADVSLNVHFSLIAVEKAVNGLCALNPKIEIVCLNIYESVSGIIERISKHLFPRKTVSTSRTLSCAHIFDICADEDKDGNKLPRKIWSCTSCYSLFNLTISILKNPMEELNQSVADVLCSNGSEQCRSEFKNVFEVVGAFGEMFWGKLPIEKVCKEIINCK